MAAVVRLLDEWSDWKRTPKSLFSAACPSDVCSFVTKTEPAAEPATRKGADMPAKPLTTSRLGWVLALTSTAYFMVVLDALVVITALPRMQHDLHVGVSTMQWTVNAYGIAFAAGIITAAALGDRFGRRLIFNCG
ncbi:MAG: MFS transporter, partial [Solirubrobacterales bacterium]|nr:MFS transporter [Solirubrobacterales bacterium]